MQNLLHAAEQKIQEYEAFLAEVKQAAETLRKFVSIDLTTNGHSTPNHRSSAELVIARLKRSPQTVKQLEKALHLRHSTVQSALTRLRRKRVVTTHGGVWACQKEKEKNAAPRARKNDENPSEKIYEHLKQYGPMTVKELHKGVKLYTNDTTYYGPLHILLKAGRITHTGNVWSV